MSQREFVLADWVEILSAQLNELVKYEMSIEHTLSDLQWQGERMMGLTGSTHSDSTVNIRERVYEYPLILGGKSLRDSSYLKGVSKRLNSLVEVLLQHPVIDQAAYISHDQLVLGLDLGVMRAPQRPMTSVLMGLVDYAVEYTPQIAADSFARMIEDGERQDLTFHAIMVFRGLHVEGKHNIAGELSVISWQEALKYLQPSMARSLVGKHNSIGREPLGAVVVPGKWGPAIVPQDFDFEANWPARNESFRDDALLLIDLMAVTHSSRVRSTGGHTMGVEQEIERLTGTHPFPIRFARILSDDLSNVVPPVTPEMSPRKFSEVASLFEKICNDQSRWRLALSRLASSLSRSGPHANSDAIIDVAIALEIMYQLESEHAYKLATRASYFLGGNAEDRVSIFETVKDFYKARSSIVHGRPKYNEDVFAKGFGAARRTLSKLALEGSPSKASNWDQLVIAGGVKYLAEPAVTLSIDNQHPFVQG